MLYGVCSVINETRAFSLFEHNYRPRNRRTKIKNKIKAPTYTYMYITAIWRGVKYRERRIVCVFGRDVTDVREAV